MYARLRRAHHLGRKAPLRLLGIVGATVAAGAALVMPTASTPIASGWCANTGPLNADDLPSAVAPETCDLTGRTIVAGSAQLAVPAPGHGVAAVDSTAISESTLLVLTSPDGVVSISRKSPEDQSAGGAVAAPPAGRPAAPGQAALAAPPAAVAKAPACRDNTYKTMGYKFTGRFDWRYNPARTPTYLGQSALPSVMQGTVDVTRGTNKCGIARPVRLSHRYLGTTSKAPQITSSGGCANGGDGQSVTGWMSMPKVLAYTCSYYTWNGKSWIVSESDMALSTSFKWFAAGVPKGCRYVFDLRSVVVHERGHTFGLGHVDYKAHASLTMSPYTTPCTTGNRTLGYGDYRGLSTMYGVS